MRVRLLLPILFLLGWLRPAPVLAQTGTATWQWASRAAMAGSSSDFSYGNCIKADAAGNSVSAGLFFGTITLGSAMFSSADGFDGFVVRHTSTGAVAWARHLNGSVDETVVNGLGLDGSSNTYVAGYYRGSMTVGTTVLNGGGGFLIKYDPLGNMLWARSIGPDAALSGAAVDAAGNVTVVGTFSSALTLGSTVLTAANGDFFVARFDAQGTASWARQIAGQTNDEAAVGLDAAGNAYVASQFRGTATLGSTVLAGNTTDDEAFVASYSPAGLLRWATRVAFPATTTTNETIFSLATSADGSCYLAGPREDIGPAPRQWFVAQCSASGTSGWSYTAPVTNGTGFRTAVDATGNVYLIGTVRGALDLGGLTVASASPTDSDFCLLSFTPQGNPRWALSTGGPTSEEGATSGAFDGNGALYVTGVLQGNATLGNLTVPQQSTLEEFFAARLTPGGVTAVRNEAMQAPLHAWPNPVRDGQVHIGRTAGLAEKARATLTDATGRQVRQWLLAPAAAETNLDLHGLAPGVYTLHVVSASASTATRLVVE
ncbi:T9SS type A sorting domain-containing protein [Hymenobacter busanensis]|uniref:T9SS type A sorting domain-containing protein n=1 Tax=Hymenobacter busanensis TaxID=2607656 RepID=A0A7L5A210_9BACT|nr:T9SS type A sorting domain-containing protein [Hymenobacter busanensis]KAA9325558.1 T9SS type A sorting domain-containing protein [Hymenobacter busanensis]QHJ07770.1 T9SS type A sorting domain-containing protein [Hymenobacter busanensis]